MPPKKQGGGSSRKGTTLSLTELTQQIQTQQQQKIQQQIQKAKEEEAQKAAAAAAKKKDKKDKKKQDTKAPTTPTSATPKSATKGQEKQLQQKTQYQISEDGQKMADVFNEVLGEDQFSQIDQPVLYYLISVIQAQNNINTKIKEAEVADLLALFFTQTLNQVNDEKAKELTTILLNKLKETKLLLELQETQETVKMLEEAVNLGKQFETQLKTQQTMIKSVVPNLPWVPALGFAPPPWPSCSPPSSRPCCSAAPPRPWTLPSF
jgi:hypothetical protein